MENVSTTPERPHDHRWTVASSLSAVVTAIVASACCIGPLVFAALGIGGAGLLIKLEPYRPYFIALTLAILGVGFYVTYRNPKPTAAPAGGPECACERPRTHRLGKVMLWAATVIVIVALAFPYLASHLFG